MPDNADDRSLAPRRTLNGPVLPPPPPELEEQARKAEADAAAAREAQQRKEADKQAKAQAKAEAREAQSQARAEAKQAKAAKADGRPRRRAGRGGTHQPGCRARAGPARARHPDVETDGSAGRRPRRPRSPLGPRRRGSAPPRCRSRPLSCDDRGSGRGRRPGR